MKTKELVLSAECLVLSAKKMLMIALCAVGFAAFAVEPADTVVYGTIRTAEAADYVEGAIAVKDGKYVYVGDEAGVAAFVKDGVTEIVDHRGKGMVMPGCTDGHSHYLNTFAMDNMKGGVLFDLGENKTNVLEKLEKAARAASEAGKTSLCGFGWNSQILLNDKPALTNLDEVTHGVSTVILDSSGHHAFCNSECLRRCGIIDGKGGVLITEIPGGLLELDDKDYPTGYVNERVTGYLTRMGGIDPDELIDDAVAEVAIRKSQELLLSTGYTSAMDAWSNNLHPSNLYVVANRMDVSGDLKFALSMTYEVEPWQSDEAISNEIRRLDSLRATYGTEHVRPEYLKVFMDGVVEARTGATYKPYKKDETHPEKYYYKSFWSVDRLAEITANCNAWGLTVHTHTMGDAAIRETVDAYVKANELRNDNTQRNCLVHLRNVSTNLVNDFQRMAENNIACAAGPTWHTMDTEFAGMLRQFLDDEYVDHAYPIKSFFDAGVKVSSHSDYPANKPSPQDPFGMMHVAVNGMVPDPGEKDYPFDTNELITVEQAFQALTLNGAWQLGLENERGSIAVGKWADFVLADQDVFACAKTDIGKTKAVSTWFEGEMVYPPPPPVIVSAVSAEGSLDLTVGDRVAKAEETLVVDPVWGNAETATVKLQNGWARTYTCASNDLWDTMALTPGRHGLALRAGEGETGVLYGAFFWKTGDDWVVLDLPPYSTEGIEFQADKTYLALGQYEFAPDKTLTVLDGAKFEYGAGAGFKGGKLEAPRRYAKVDVGDGLYQIVEKIKGSKDNPWIAGGDASQPENVVEAYTNGTELVFVGRGTIADLSEIPADVKGSIAAITIGDGVTDAAAGVFFGFDGITVTLQDNWKGELPDEKDTWCGATNVKLTRVPTAVKNVKVQQRYPWNGKVDVDFDLTGEGAVKVTLSARVDGKKIKNPTVTSGTTFDLGTGKELKDCRITWDAKADFGDTEKHEKIKVKLTVEKAD